MAHNFDKNTTTKKIYQKPKGEQMITYKFRMYPHREAREKLDFALDICRQTYNNLLEEMNKQFKIDRKVIQHKIVELKEARPELKEVYSKNTSI